MILLTIFIVGFTILILLVLLIISFLLNFYKDPVRIVPEGNDVVASADGRIISIIDTSIDEMERKIKIKKGILGKISTLSKEIANECYVISIFMSPLNCHYNRAPIEGTVKSVKHTKGKFFKAYDLEKSFENEKNEIVIQNEKLKVKVIQIAGFLARRIKCYVTKNKKVNKGEKIGMIALGSQTTIILPNHLRLNVKVGDKVIAGETVIAV